MLPTDCCPKTTQLVAALALLADISHGFIPGDHTHIVFGFGGDFQRLLPVFCGYLLLFAPLNLNKLSLFVVLGGFVIIGKADAFGSTSLLRNLRSLGEAAPQGNQQE